LVVLLRVIALTPALAFVELRELELEETTLRATATVVVCVATAATAIVLRVGATSRIAGWWGVRWRTAIRAVTTRSIITVVAIVGGVTFVAAIIPV
jgi:hypothetical protein